jgi:DNA polymerase elongation subunit (family B)
VKNIRGEEETVFDIVGIQQLDYLKVFKKFGVALETPENYQLNTVAQLILGEEKVQYDEEYDSLDQLYLENYQKFVDYGLYDTDLIVQLERSLQFISIAIMIAYKTGTNFSDALGTTAVWDSFIHRYLREKFVAIPPQDYNANAVNFEGGYVKDPQKGIYDWILSFDFASLYPNLIVQFNMSPETIVNEEREFYKPKDFLENENLKNRKPQYAMAANGVYFRKDQQGVLPALIEEVYAERVAIKNNMLSLQNQLEHIEDELKRRGL